MGYPGCRTIPRPSPRNSRSPFPSVFVFGGGLRGPGGGGLGWVGEHPLRVDHPPLADLRDLLGGHQRRPVGDHRAVRRHEDHVRPLREPPGDRHDPPAREVRPMGHRRRGGRLQTEDGELAPDLLDGMEEGEERLRVPGPGLDRGVRERRDAHRPGLLERAGGDPPELGQVGADPEGVARVHRQGPDVRPRIGGYVEEGGVRVPLEPGQVVDRPDPSLALDRGADRRGLEDRPRELPDHALQVGLPDRCVERDQADVALRQVEHQRQQLERRADADPQEPRDPGVEGAGVAGLLEAQDVPDPRRHLVGARAPGLVDQQEGALGEALDDLRGEGHRVGHGPAGGVGAWR
jgi:hypothetical protein